MLRRLVVLGAVVVALVGCGEEGDPIPGDFPVTLTGCVIEDEPEGAFCRAGSTSATCDKGVHPTLPDTVRFVAVYCLEGSHQEGNCRWTLEGALELPDDGEEGVRLVQALEDACEAD